MTKPPPLVGLFQCTFPGFGTGGDPHANCDMALHIPGGPCYSVRYAPCGAAGVDHDGRVWVLVIDYAIQRRPDGVWATFNDKLRWVMFQVPVAE